MEWIVKSQDKLWLPGAMVYKAWIIKLPWMYCSIRLVSEVISEVALPSGLIEEWRPDANDTGKRVIVCCICKI